MRSIFILAFLIWSFVAFGQEPYLLHWTEFNGLPDNRVNYCELDQQGYLWIATYNGVARFDGEKFEKYQNQGKNKYSVNANNITHIKTISDGKIWFAGYGGGISIYDPQKRVFKHITADDDTASLRLKENRVNGFTETGNGSVISHYRGPDALAGGITFLDLDGNVERHYLSNLLEKYDLPIKFKVLGKDPYVKDTYWLPARKFYAWNPTSEELDTFEFPYPNNNWLDVKAVLFRDNERIITAGLNGVHSFQRENQKWTSHIKTRINYADLDKDNLMWVTTNQGMGTFNFETNEIEYVFTIGNGGSAFKKGTQIIRFFFLDDFLWICTTDGLYAWHERFEHIKSTTIQHNKNIKFNLIRYVDSLSEKEDLYLDRKGQICLVDQEYKLLEYNTINSVVHGHAYDRENGILYIAADDGLFVWDEDLNQAEKLENRYEIDKIDNLEIWSVYYDKKHKSIWFGTKKNGLYRYDIQQKKLNNFRHDPKNPKSLCFDRYLFKITEGPDHNLWISTDKGISIIDPESLEFIIYPKIVTALGDNIIHHTTSDDSSNIWIGTRDHGLYRFNPFTREIKNYTIEHGLPFTGVNRILHHENKLIFSTRAGLCIKEDGSENIVTFGKADGIQNPDLYYPILNINRENQLIFSNEGSEVINLLDLDNYRQEIDSLQLNIEKIHLFKDEKEVPYEGPLQDIQLEPSQNNFSIDFAGINFLRPQDVTYRYRLKGHDDSWIYSGSANSVIYTHVPGGSYSFEVQASADEKSWTPSKSVEIFLKKHWYQTLFFKTTVFLLIVSLIYWFYRLQMEKVRIKESFQKLAMMAELKALRSQMNPHFLFNSLNSIKSFIAENDRRNASTYLNKFSMLMRLILNHSRQEVVSLDEEIKSLKLYIDMEKLRIEKLDYSINVSEEIHLDTTFIQPMLIQPFIENAIWHGLLQKKQGGKLTLDFTKKDDLLHVTVEDNGVGRKHAQMVKSKTSLNKKSFGMKITQERLGIHDEENTDNIKITDLVDAEGKPCGTKVEIMIKVSIQDQPGTLAEI